MTFFFNITQKEMFKRMFMLLFSIQRKWMVTMGQALQMTKNNKSIIKMVHVPQTLYFKSSEAICEKQSEIFIITN